MARNVQLINARTAPAGDHPRAGFFMPTPVVCGTGDMHMKAFLTRPDAMGRPTSVLLPSDHSHVLILTANQAKVANVPAGSTMVLFSATGDFWAKLGGAAAIPVADNVAGTAPELNPTGRDCEGVSTIGLVAPADCLVNLVFFG
jgi:hypothetical protein